MFREAAASAISQPVASVVTILMVAGMIVAVLLTTGRAVGAQRQILGSIDSTGTRSIVVQAETGAGLTADVLDRIGNIEGIEWSAALSAAVDAKNSIVSDGSRVPVRLAYGSDLGRLGAPASSEPRVYASRQALDELGLADIAGSVTTTEGVTYSVGGQLAAPDFLASFEPLALVPQPENSGQSIGVLIVIAKSPDAVAPVADAVLSVLAVDDPTRVSVQTSETLAELRALVDNQLSSFSRGLVLIVLGLTGTLVAVILYGLVMMRRKDFGRRRALGATKAWIISLLLIQTAILALVGVVLGSAVSLVSLLAASDPLPGAEFFLQTGILAIATAMLAALIPAVAASRREPIRELRVP